MFIHEYFVICQTLKMFVVVETVMPILNFLCVLIDLFLVKQTGSGKSIDMKPFPPNKIL